jgi:hypothetical protein
VIEIMHVLSGADAVVATPPDEPRGDYEVPAALNERLVRD